MRRARSLGKFDIGLVAPNAIGALKNGRGQSNFGDVADFP
jgi:hypothetical protein